MPVAPARRWIQTAAARLARARADPASRSSATEPCATTRRRTSARPVHSVCSIGGAAVRCTAAPSARWAGSAEEERVERARAGRTSGQRLGPACSVRKVEALWRALRVRAAAVRRREERESEQAPLAERAIRRRGGPRAVSQNSLQRLQALASGSQEASTHALVALEAVAEEGEATERAESRVPHALERSIDEALGTGRHDECEREMKRREENNASGTTRWEGEDEGEVEGEAEGRELLCGCWASSRRCMRSRCRVRCRCRW